MATFQQEVGRAIAAVIGTFSTHVQSGGAVFGATWNDNKKAVGAKGRCLVVSQRAPEPVLQGDSDQLVNLSYDCRFELINPSDAAANVHDLDTLMRRAFNPESRVLQAAYAALPPTEAVASPSVTLIAVCEFVDERGAVGYPETAKPLYRVRVTGYELRS